MNEWRKYCSYEVIIAKKKPVGDRYPSRLARGNAPTSKLLTSFPVFPSNPRHTQLRDHTRMQSPSGNSPDSGTASTSTPPLLALLTLLLQSQCWEESRGGSRCWIWCWSLSWDRLNQRGGRHWSRRRCQNHWTNTVVWGWGRWRVCYFKSSSNITL
jgi:hypothetical protein